MRFIFCIMKSSLVASYCTGESFFKTRRYKLSPPFEHCPSTPPNFRTVVHLFSCKCVCLAFPGDAQVADFRPRPKYFGARTIIVSSVWHAFSLAGAIFLFAWSQNFGSEFSGSLVSLVGAPRTLDEFGHHRALSPVCRSQRSILRRFVYLHQGCGRRKKGLLTPEKKKVSSLHLSPIKDTRVIAERDAPSLPTLSRPTHATEVLAYEERTCVPSISW